MEHIVMTVGGQPLDVDGKSVATIVWENPYFGEWRQRAMTVALGLSVPTTDANRRAFDHSDMPGSQGTRARKAGTLMSGGLLLYGWYYLSRWAAGRFELVFRSGSPVFDILSQRAPGWMFPDELEYRPKIQMSAGSIPDFGWYRYRNGVSEGVLGEPLDAFPVASLGYIIDTLADYAGYSVIYPDASLGTWYSAANYGLVMAGNSVYNEEVVTVTGSGYGGWSVQGDLAAAGLQIRRLQQWVRGVIPSFVSVYSFVATRPVTVKFEGQAGIVVVGELGRASTNGWAEGDTLFSLDTGQHFSVISADEVVSVFGEKRVAGPLASHPGYQGTVSFSFVTGSNGGVATSGDTLKLSWLLPKDKTLLDYLQAYCLLINAYMRIDDGGKTIEVVPFARTVEDWQTGRDADYDLDGYAVAPQPDSVCKYIEGWSQHNIVRAASAADVPEGQRFRRDYPVVNDYLDEEREIGVIPFNDGEAVPGDGYYPEFYYEDVDIAANGDVKYRGTLSIIAANPDPAGAALHISGSDVAGVGAEFAAFTAVASEVRVKVRFPMSEILNIGPGTLMAWRGAVFIPKSITWQGGVADMTLLSVGI